jgi:hypothetical protein
MPFVTGREVVQVIEGSVFHLLGDDQRPGLRELPILGSVLELGPFPKPRALIEHPEDQKAALLMSFDFAGHGFNGIDASPCIDLTPAKVRDS